MPATSLSSARSRRAPPPRRHRSRTRPASRAARIRWDRLGRLAMLGVMAALLYLYIGAGVSVLSTLHEARRNSALVRQLERQNQQLVAQHAALRRRGTLVREARQLGMGRPAEQPYVVQGLPPN